MECAAKGRGTPCVGPPTKRCGRCGAVSYCSASHQMSHWSEHKEECDRLEQQMKRVDELNDFPFTFAEEATIQIFDKKESRCSFLSKLGIHQVGAWMCECHCGAPLASFDCPSVVDRLKDVGWDLSSDLCPCCGPSSLLSQHLHDWADYYEWRCIPLKSPAALLLHWPLMIYHATQVAYMKSWNSRISNELCIHYLGVEKEILQLAAFRELLALFPGVQVRVELIGPRIPKKRDGEKFEFRDYAQCLDTDCICKSSKENASWGENTSKSSTVMLQLHRGFYHDRYRDIIAEESSPHLIVAPNAGIAAYTSWLPTLELIQKINVPAIFSDYCEEACHRAACCISIITGSPLRVPIQLNPFRQPMMMEDCGLSLPCYSNCFLFGM